MEWDALLIYIYLTVCDLFKQDRVQQMLRKSPNSVLNFTDEEVMTIYIFCILRGYHVIKYMHQFVYVHLKKWFPNLPKYSTFNHRLNFLKDEFELFSIEFIQHFHDKIHHPENLVVLDSMPIMLAKGSRARKAKVAKGIADLGYCASKKIHYHGVKLHLFADYVANSLPNPNHLKITNARMHDLTAVRKILSDFTGCKIIADKAYIDGELKTELHEKNNVDLHTPVKLSKSKKQLTEHESLYSKIINSFRQQIEIFFSWIASLTGIQNGGRIRSESGLHVHVFGRFLAAMILLLLQKQV
jgi:hypothetical protein